MQNQTYEKGLQLEAMNISTYEDALKFVRRTEWHHLRLVPEEFKTYELCAEAVKLDGHALTFVPNRLKTPELCLKAVKQKGWIILHVPEKLQSLEMCIIALQDNPDNIRFIKNQSQDLIDYCKLMNITYE